MRCIIHLLSSCIYTYIHELMQTILSAVNYNYTIFQVHRRNFYDDGRGLSEPLDEPGQFGDGLITRGVHYVLLDNYENSTIYHRLLGQWSGYN